MKLIVGLGNPGAEYTYTFHNAGFQVIDELSQRLRGDMRFVAPASKRHRFFESEEFQFQKADGSEERIVLLKPQTYMNESGRAVAEFSRRFKSMIDPQSDLWVVHDDGDIQLGRIRVDMAKRAAGHRGVVSIMTTLGIRNGIRFRMGIRREGDARRTETFVLKKPLAADRELWKETITRCAHGIIDALENGIPHAQMTLHANNKHEKRPS
ncbi:aminoacyl-tRNA hydrolase [Candidatus Uhrbacteria bacterium]|nr:aminoacyl-tRNA hydrolase [Candidatus Uhrbacteria bacterium]